MPHPAHRLLDPRDPLRAMTLLTRLPVRGADGARDAASAWAWPLVGVVIGLGAAALAQIALLVGLPPAVAAGLVLATGIVLTGGLHEDGLADCADGFWGGTDIEQRLEIMKDSRIGSYGVLVLILTIGLQWAALTSLIEADKLWIAAILLALLSRAAMAAVMAALPFARADGLARHVGRPAAGTAVLACAIGGLGAVLLAGWAGLAAGIATGAAALAMARLSGARIGGQTGDVLGAVQQTGATAALLTLAATV